MGQSSPATALELPDEVQVVVAGAWHGNTQIARQVIERAAAVGVHTILHVGDLGIGP